MTSDFELTEIETRFEYELKIKIKLKLDTMFTLASINVDVLFSVLFW